MVSEVPTVFWSPVGGGSAEKRSMTREPELRWPIVMLAALLTAAMAAGCR